MQTVWDVSGNFLQNLNLDSENFACEWKIKIRNKKGSLRIVAKFGLPKVKECFYVAHMTDSTTMAKNSFFSWK